MTSLSAAALSLALVAGACGSGSGSGDAATEAGEQTGSVHVAWVIESASGSPTDCISANTNNIEIAITNASQTPVLTSFNYCVDMHETFGGLAPGDYSIQLSLQGNGRVVAAATATVTVTAGGVADAGTLTLKLAGS
jgi:hypothetical protein